MAARSSVLAWRIPGTGEPGGLPSMGSHRVGHGWSDLAVAAACMYVYIWGFLGGLVVKNPPAIQKMQETPQVWSLVQEDPLEKGMATHSSILAWRIPGTEEPGRLQSIRSHRVGHAWSHGACMHTCMYISWDCKESDRTQWLTHTHTHICYLVFEDIHYHV